MKLIVITLFLSLLISGCLASTINTTKLNTSPKNLGKVAVASFFKDEIRGVRSDGWENTILPITKVPWETNKKTYDVITGQLENNNILIVTASYGKNIFEKASRDSEEETVQEISKLLSSSMGDSNIDSFIILTQNSIDSLGRQHSALRNFGLMGPVGVLFGEVAKEKGAYMPSYMLAVNVGFHEKMVGKSRCLIGFDMYVVDAKTNQILGKRNSALGLQEISSDVWGENLVDYSKLDEEKIEKTCNDALENGIVKALIDLGLIKSTELQASTSR